MQQHFYYIKFALRFADMQIPELELSFAACHSKSFFNAQVQCRGWSSMRAYHDQALIDEFFASEATKSSASDAASILLPLPMEKLFLSPTLSGTTYSITS